MICPKCKKEIEDSATVCPHCKKVLALVCPKCGSVNDTATCANCNYIILSKCAKCGKLNKTEDGFCSCGESTVQSAVKNRVNIEEFASLTICFENIGKLEKILGAKNLITKFLFKLKNMVLSFAKDNKLLCVMPKEATFVINFSEDATEYSSAINSMKTAIKFLNMVCNLNRTLKKELMFSLEMRMSIEKKVAEEFFDVVENSDKIKLLDLYTAKASDSKGLQIIADEFVYKLLRKEYVMESLYSTERNQEIVSYYSLNIDKYIVPVSKDDDKEVDMKPRNLKVVTKRETDYEQELYKKNIEGIRVNCKFEQMGAEQVLDFIREMNFSSGSRIISIRADAERLLPTKNLVEILKKDVPCYTVVCTDFQRLYPWEFFRCLLAEIERNGNSFHLSSSADVLLNSLKTMSPPNLDTAEDARLKYIEVFISLLTSLPQCVIYIENFNYIDVASMRVLEEVFSKIGKTKLSFVITNSREYALQKQMPDLLNSYYYTEIFVGQMDISVALTQILDSEDFRDSFYYKKIVDNSGAAYQYCVHAVNHLKDCGIILNFNDKIVLTDSKTVLLPFDLKSLIIARLKKISHVAAKSLVLAYSYILGPVLSFVTLDKLGLNNKNYLDELEASGFIYQDAGNVYIQNYEILKEAFRTSLKPDVLKYLASNLLNKFYTETSREYPVVTCLDYIGNSAVEFSKLYEFSIITLQFGDYDTYLKMCIRLLGLLKKLEKDLPTDEINEYQADFYNNLTQLLYRYAPERIYPIAESLLQKALENKEDDKIKTLSNMMLQGGLLTGNYTNAQTLLQNILERTENCVLVDKNGKLNKRVFALSLVGIEIYFSVGEYAKCINLCEEILQVMTPEKLLELKPDNFDEEQFKVHVSDSFTYYLLSNVLVFNTEIKVCIEKIASSFGYVPEYADCFVKLNNFLIGENDTAIEISEEAGLPLLFSMLFKALIEMRDDVTKFATTCYEFKKLATELSNACYVLLGDLLVGHSYYKLGDIGKAEHIYNNVFAKAKQNSLFFVSNLSSYFIADLRMSKGDYQTALQLVTNGITLLERSERPCLLLLYMFKKMFVKVVGQQGYKNIDISSEVGFISQFEQKFPVLVNII